MVYYVYDYIIRKDMGNNKIAEEEYEIKADVAMY